MLPESYQVVIEGVQMTPTLLPDKMMEIKEDSRPDSAEQLSVC
jgi:hypothetical protein